MCRKNDQCSEISSFLIENKIDVKSDEISTFSSIKEVEVLVSFLALKTDPKNKDHIKEILKYFAHVSRIDEKYSFISSSIIKDIARHDGNLENLVDEYVEMKLRKKVS